MLFLIIDLLLIAISLYICKKNDFTIPQKRYSYISLTIPFIIAAMVYLSFFSVYIALLTLIGIILSLYYYINKATEFLNSFMFKKAFHLLGLFIVMNLFGGFLINLVRFNMIESQNLALILFLVGVTVFMYARYGFVALTSVIAEHKGLSKYLGFFGILGVIGVIIVCIMKSKK